jgi:hypothetical protein
MSSAHRHLAYPESPEAFVVLHSGVLDLQAAQNLCGNGRVALNDPDHTYGSVSRARFPLVSLLLLAG